MMGLVFTGGVSRLNAKGKNTRGPIIVAAGRRVDAPDAKVARFPPQSVPKVRKKLRQLLMTKALRTSKVEVLKLPEGQEGYLETNLRLLHRAQVLAKQEHTTVNALVVWNSWANLWSN